MISVDDDRFVAIFPVGETILYGRLTGEVALQLLNWPGSK